MGGRWPGDGDPRQLHVVFEDRALLAPQADRRWRGGGAAAASGDVVKPLLHQAAGGGGREGAHRDQDAILGGVVGLKEAADVVDAGGAEVLHGPDDGPRVGMVLRPEERR